MNIDSHDRQVPTMDDEGLQKQLAGEDFVISATSPILQHLLVNRDEALFSDEVIARVRGITANIAFQLLVARAVEAGESDPAVAAISGQDAVARSLIEDEVFVAYIHALTLEAKLAESIRQRSGVDHVLSLLIQHLTASPDEKTVALAIRTIAAQARFIQQMRARAGTLWTDFVEFAGNSQRQPVHWRLLDGVELKLDGSDRGWTALLVPLGKPAAGSDDTSFIL